MPYDLTFIEYEGTETFHDPVSGSDRTVPIYRSSWMLEGRWSGKKLPPAIGDRVTINFNGLGPGTVESYFIEDRWLGVKVKLDKQPEWHRKQNPGRDFALVFGRELD